MMGNDAWLSNVLALGLVHGRSPRMYRPALLASWRTFVSVLPLNLREGPLGDETKDQPQE